MTLPVRVDNPTERAAVCAGILNALPQWFGIRAARDAYIAEARNLPVHAVHEEGRPIGVLSLKAHNAWTVEIHVMGVLPDRQRMGVGRALVEQAVRVSRDEGRTFLTVKTLAEQKPDRHYAATRTFYQAMEFRPLEVFPELWGAGNPCLVMIRLL